ncbi:hypothetical protein Sjap_004387 [Stephania japonica]|uniref:3-hydroxyisobutyryl-CoA hydrolase n=1 Tax=Stephania japonica TaxID=461633 RepID=A0AAP0K3G4_9MAGN
MGGGASLSMLGRFHVVTENAVFAMPEASLGLSPTSYFLSRFPGFYGEYLGPCNTHCPFHAFAVLRKGIVSKAKGSVKQPGQLYQI